MIMVGSAEGWMLNELEAVRKVFGTGEDGPVLISSSQAAGEVFAASPILNAIIGAKILESASLPECLSCCGVGDWNGSARFRKIGSAPARILINSVSYEGQCASMIIEAFQSDTP